MCYEYEYNMSVNWVKNRRLRANLAEHGQTSTTLIGPDVDRTLCHEKHIKAPSPRPNGFGI